MSIEAMKQALEALALVASSDEWHGCQTYEGQIATSAYEALRQAIEQAEKQEPAFYVIPATDRFGEGYEQTFWEDPAGFPVYTRPVVHEVRCTYPQCQATNGCVGSCSKGQPDLAKVGEVGVWGDKREWVGLTKDEVDSWQLPVVPTVFQFAQFVEAKLKEKNS